MAGAAITRGLTREQLVRRTVLAVVATLGVSSAAFAQAAETGPAYRGLFRPREMPAPARPYTASADTFDLAVALSQLVETTTLSTRASALDDAPPDAHYTLLDTTASRRHAGRRHSYDLAGGSQFRRYGHSGQALAARQWGGAEFKSRLTKRTTLLLSSQASYSPTYILDVPLSGPRAADGSAALPGIEVDDLRSVSAASTVALSRRFKHRAVLEAGYTFNGVRFLDSDVLVTDQRASVLMRRAAGQSLSLQVRYDYTQVNTRLTDGRQVAGAHQVDLGADWALSAATRLSIGVTPGLATGDPAGLPRDTAAPPNALSGRVGARASVEHAFTGSWRVGAGYQRALYTDQGYTRPIFADTGTAQIDGRLSRWVTVSAAGAYSTGRADRRSDGRAVSTFSYSTRMSLQVSRQTALSLEYLRFGSAGSQGPLARPSSGAQIDQRRLQAGVMVAF